MGLAVLSIPSSIFAGNVTAQAIVFSVELAVLTLIAVPVLISAWREPPANEPNPFIGVFAPVYLGVLLVLWLSALPDYFGAVDGVTVDGTPTGNLVYAAASFIAAALCAAAGITASSTRRIYSDALP